MMENTVQLIPCLALLVVMAHTASLGGSGSNLEHFSVFLDLGSTGTKLKLYRWREPEQRGVLPTVRLVQSTKFKPGISTLGGGRDELVEYLRPILDLAKQTVPEAERARTPIFAMATAGFRYLSEKVSGHVMSEIQSVLSDPLVSPFLYQADDLQILSGEEEGVYAWLALNYLLGFFDSHRPSNQSHGIMEMGGSSTQIAFVPTDPIYAGEFQISLLGHTYQLYVHSYLDFGLTALQRRLAALLDSAGTQDNPCLLQGDTKEYQQDDDHTVTNQGTGDAAACRRLLSQLLHPDSGLPCQPKPCAIGSQYQPRVDGVPFYATQGFVYTPSDLQAIDPEGDLDLDTLEHTGEQYCAKTLTEAVGEGMNPKFASAGCLESQYIPLLISSAYRFPADSHIKATSKIDGERIDWALGAVLMQLSRRSEFQSCVERQRR